MNLNALFSIGLHMNHLKLYWKDIVIPVGATAEICIAQSQQSYHKFQLPTAGPQDPLRKSHRKSSSERDILVSFIDQ